MNRKSANYKFDDITIGLTKEFSIEITESIEYIDINKITHANTNCCGTLFPRIPCFFLNPVGFCEINRG